MFDKATFLPEIARMSRWFRSAAKAQPPMIAAEEEEHLHSVEHALLKLLNDDIDAADKILKQHDSSYHHLGRGISSFLASMLGVEKELLKDAAAALQTAETKTWEDMKKAQRDPAAHQSAIYPPGTEYLLCYAIAQLTSAITAVVSGSVTEAIKGFYKLRKAYLTLDGILKIETDYLKRHAAYQPGSVEKDVANHLINEENKSPRPRTASSTSHAHEPLTEKRPSYEPVHPAGEEDAFDSATMGKLTPASTIAPTATRVKSNLLEQDPATLGITSHTDIFVHSGTRLCYGILLVVFSMIESPIFTKILHIVGFKGDRERGTRYLWESARFNNFNSAIAGIALLGYYNGLVGICDILPTDAGAENNLQGYPKAKCEALLADMIKRYPDSKLWKLEEARMLGYNKNLDAAVEILASNSNSNVKQIATINMFEMSLAAMIIHDYQLSANCWIQVAELSSWSPTMYAYMTGACNVELYRNLRDTDPTGAQVYKDKATEYIKKGPPLAGRQKVMSKELPFDIFIVRKVKKWEERAKAWNSDLIDAIGTSPLDEMMCKSPVGQTYDLFLITQQIFGTESKSSRQSSYRKA